VIRTPTPEELQQVDHSFAYHAPTGTKGERHAAVRGTMLESARQVLELCPPSRERAIALTKLREAMMWANAAIACGPAEL
jgi:hypothetical protein